MKTIRCALAKMLKGPGPPPSPGPWPGRRVLSGAGEQRGDPAVQSAMRTSGKASRLYSYLWGCHSQLYNLLPQPRSKQTWTQAARRVVCWAEPPRIRGENKTPRANTQKIVTCKHGGTRRAFESKHGFLAPPARLL